MADPHWSPPQEIGVETWIELVGMRATALRADLLNSALSVGRPGAYDKFNLLISARMGVGHAGVAIKRSSTRQRTVLGRFIDDGQIFAKNRRHEYRGDLWIRNWKFLKLQLRFCPDFSSVKNLRVTFTPMAAA